MQKCPHDVIVGGQKQRLAIAGAIAANKEQTIYDEPTNGAVQKSGKYFYM